MVNKINSKTGLMAVVLVSATILFSPVQANVVRMAFSGLKDVVSAGAVLGGVGLASSAYALDKDKQEKIIMIYEENFMDSLENEKKEKDPEAYASKINSYKNLVDLFQVPVGSFGAAFAVLGFTSIVLRRNPRIISKIIK